MKKTFFITPAERKLANQMASDPVKHRHKWIGVDFDGTLAEAQCGMVFGKAIQPMVERVKWWLYAGIKVKILTARANPDNVDQYHHWIDTHREWLLKHFTKEEEKRIGWTCSKDHQMAILFDDRAYRVVRDKGELEGGLYMEGDEGSITVTPVSTPHQPGTTQELHHPLPIELIPQSVPQVMDDCLQTFKDRDNQYGKSYVKFGAMMDALFPDGLTVKGKDSFVQLGVFVQQVSKLMRICSGSFDKVHMDSARDLSVYAAIMASYQSYVDSKPKQ